MHGEIPTCKLSAPEFTVSHWRWSAQVSFQRVSTSNRGGINRSFWRDSVRPEERDQPTTGGALDHYRIAANLNPSDPDFSANAQRLALDP